MTQRQSKSLFSNNGPGVEDESSHMEVAQSLTGSAANDDSAKNQHQPTVDMTTGLQFDQRDALHPILPRRPGFGSLALRATSQRTPRAKRRRLAGAGKRWASAVDKFVLQIPPVPFFSDPRRPVPMRDMRGWISIISKSTQTLVWQRFMGELKQEDLDDNGDKDICRHILSSVVHEAQDPSSERRQTRQAVNNAIKRELSLPKATGQTGRGETFREVFREKAIYSGFRLTPIEKNSDKEEPQMQSEDITMLDTPGLAGSSRANEGRSVSHGVNGDMRVMSLAMNSSRPHYSRPVGQGARGKVEPTRVNFFSSGGYGVDALLDVARWNEFESRCKRTAAGQPAWWGSPDLSSPELLSSLCSHLVRTTNIAELKRLLVDFRWVRRHAISGSHGVMQLVTKGYDALLAIKTEALTWFEREGYRLIRNALMLIDPILRPELDSMKDVEADRQSFCAHLASQLYGRLLKASREFAVILTLLESIRTQVKPPWLRPLNPCFDAPKTDIALSVKASSNSLASAVAISADGEFVVIPGDPHRGKNTVRVWEVATGNCITIICTGAYSWSIVAITPNKKTVITSSTGAGGDGPLMFWNIIDERRRYIKEVNEQAAIVAMEQKDMIFDVAVHPNNKWVIGASNGSIRMWNVEGGEVEKEFKGVSGTIYDLDLTPDGSLLLAGVTGGAIGLWDVSSGERLLVIKNEEPTNLSYPIPFSKHHDMEKKLLPDAMTDISGGDRLYCVSFMVDRVQKAGSSTDNKKIKVVCGGDANIRIWTLPDPRVEPASENMEMELTKTFRFSGFGIINNIRCTDENTMFFGSGDGCVRMVKLKDELKDDKTPAPIIFGTDAPPAGRRSSTDVKCDPVFISVSDNGQKVATGTDRPFVLVWDVGQYEETLKENSNMLSQSLDPFNLSMGYRDKFQNNVNDMAKILHPSRNPMRELRIDKLASKENVFKLQVLPNQDVRTIVFDRNIDLERCRVGLFSKSDETGEAGELEDGEGVSIKLKDGSVALFEAERGITQQAAKVP